MKKNILIKVLLSLVVLLFSCKGKNTKPKSKTLNLIDTKGIKFARKSKLSDDEMKKWWRLDIINDTIPGTSIDRAYKEIIKNNTGSPVIVAIIDTGLDVNHEDLKPVLWENAKEIVGNKKDDDNNGYVDDINGWNFIGQSNTMKSSFTRVVKKLAQKYKDLTPSSVLQEDKAEYKMYIEAKKIYDDIYSNIYPQMQEDIKRLKKLKSAHSSISKALKKEDYTKEDLSNIKDKNLKLSIDFVNQTFSLGLNPISEIKRLEKYISDYKEMFKSIDLSSSDRTTNDNPNDINDFKYGNNKLDGGILETAAHGTHVAGIIAAVRGNGIGMDGVANNVKIMAIRTIPAKDGDENDKDVALAIRYAVDNGAKVINMSFNKAFSINAQWVKEAIKYAQKKDVLLVNSAGNDSENTDNTSFFPNDQAINSSEFVDNYITVGSTSYKYDKTIVSNFSNYGKKRVDIFAPGEQIWSTMPENKYDFDSGTSMSAPLVAGIAAVVRSQYPNLSASEVKNILMDSGVQIEMKVNVPSYMGGNIGMDEEYEIDYDKEIEGLDENYKDEDLKDNEMPDFAEAPNEDTPKKLAHFSELCKSGKIVNLYNALILASRSK